MRFDDRLSTVLGLSAEAPRDRAVQWRQLVELVARGGGSGDPALLARALERIALLRPEVPDAVRAAAAKAISGADLPLGLLTLFVADRLEVAAPLLRDLDLSPEARDELRNAASSDVRALVDTIAPPATKAAKPAAPRAEKVAAVRAPQSGIFRWETDQHGVVQRVEGASRAALVGLPLRQVLPDAFAHYLPFENQPVPLSVGSADWLWSGEPMFDRASGRFEGFVGVARREGKAAEAAVQAPLLPPDGASLRELIHELRTPLTAIIGFGEIIDGQMMGPAHRAYRDRASEIVRQARQLLGAVEELDAAARARAAGAVTQAKASTAELLRSLEKSVTQRLADSGVKLMVEAGDPAARFTGDLALIQRLSTRLLEAVIDAVAKGDQVKISASVLRSRVSLSVSLPSPHTTDQLANGFALRLVRSLASLAGGSLEIASDRISLSLPSA